MINLNCELNPAEYERLTDVVTKLASNCEGVACTNCVLHYLKFYTEDGVELTECGDIAEYVLSLKKASLLKPCKLCGDVPQEYNIGTVSDGFVLTHYCSKRICRSASRLERVVTIYGDTREEVIDIWNAGPDDNNNGPDDNNNGSDDNNNGPDDNNNGPDDNNNIEEEYLPWI